MYNVIIKTTKDDQIKHGTTLHVHVYEEHVCCFATKVATKCHMQYDNLRVYN